jgi:hypothetical protein
MVHVASSRMSCGDEAEDGRVDATGYIRLFYPNFVVFVILDHNDSLVISFLINRTQRVGGEAIIHPSLSHPYALGLHFGRCGCVSCLREERREERDLPNLLKIGRMFGWFPHLVDICFASMHLWVWIESPLSMCRNVFHFLDLCRYFWPYFHSCDLKSLSLISSMGNVARIRLNMCPQS